MTEKINDIISTELSKKELELKKETQRLEKAQENAMEMKDAALSLLGKRFSPYIKFVKDLKKIQKFDDYAEVKFEIKGHQCVVVIYDPECAKCREFWGYSYNHIKKEKSISIFVDRESPRYYYGTEKYGLPLGYYAQPATRMFGKKYGFFNYFDYELVPKNRSMIDLFFVLENQTLIEQKLALELTNIGVDLIKAQNEKANEIEIMSAKLAVLIN